MKLTTTHKLLLVALIAGVGTDIWLDATDQETYSQFIKNFSTQDRLGFLLPSIFGVLTGHFFIPRLESMPKWCKFAAPIMLIAASAFARDYWYGLAIIFACGSFNGWVYWPQRR